MNYYFDIKSAHIVLVCLSVLFFNIRFILRVCYPSKPLANFWRYLPHIIDTLLMSTGITMAYLIPFIPFANAQWLGVKLSLLLCYIILGAYALKSKPRSFTAFYAYLLAMICVSLMAYLATFKPLLWS